MLASTMPELPLPAEVGEQLEKRAKELGIKYFLPAISSLSIGVHAPIVPLCAIKRTACNGSAMHGFIDFGYGGEQAECYMVPDPSTLIQLPWKPEFGWLACNLYYDGKISPRCPRTILKQQIAELKELGFVLKTGFEPEISILDNEAVKPTLSQDKPGNRYFDPILELGHADFFAKLLECLEKLGWGPYQIEREASIGQYEINFDYSDAMTSADRMLFFKFMVKDIAREFGFRASFMPFIPEVATAGANGQHIHHSLWDAETDKNVTMGDGELGLSEAGRHWLAGVLNHIHALTAIACPTTNSYKRLHMIKNFCNFNGYGVQNRYCPLRIVKAKGTSDRIEYRQPDGAANPYLIHAVLVATGIDGLKKGEDPDPLLRNQECLWGESTPKHSKLMPKSLEKAIIALKADSVLTSALGEELVKSFEDVKDMECEPHNKEVTNAERDLIDMY